MSLIKRDKFTPSLKPYAFKPDSREFGYGGRTLEALWAGRKRGGTIVTLGTYHMTAMDRIERSYEDWLAVADTRYGGLWQHIWDGEKLLSNPDNTPSLAEADALSERLDAVLQGFPRVPDGWDGWYFREKVA
tara:strand:- start:9333 stop:9728 length:396 start_codon:yes stop_codon:yes gene_type:complete